MLVLADAARQRTEEFKLRLCLCVGTVCPTGLPPSELGFIRVQTQPQAPNSVDRNRR